MRIPRIYYPEINQNQKLISLNQESSHYLVNVLRLKINHPICLFNGTDPIEFYGSISQIEKKKITIQITNQKEILNQSPLCIHLFQAISKGDRFEEAIQKATELGVTEITPLLTERVDVKLPKDRMEKKYTHWQKIIISASEQSGRTIIPKLNEIKKLSELDVQSNKDTLNLILSPYAEKKLSELKSLKSISKINLIIGPEGGLTDNEISDREKNNFTPILLGPRILRTETAPLAIISNCQLLWGDF